MVLQSKLRPPPIVTITEYHPPFPFNYYLLVVGVDWIHPSLSWLTHSASEPYLFWYSFTFHIMYMTCPFQLWILITIDIGGSSKLQYNLYFFLRPSLSATALTILFKITLMKLDECPVFVPTSENTYSLAFFTGALFFPADISRFHCSFEK